MSTEPKYRNQDNPIANEPGRTFYQEYIKDLRPINERLVELVDHIECRTGDEGEWYRHFLAIVIDDYCENEIKHRTESLRAELDAAKQKQPINTHVRLFDLVRYVRAELHQGGLITDEEYAWLSSEAPMNEGKGSPSPRRLEDYDTLKYDFARERERAEKAEAEADISALKHDIEKQREWGDHLAKQLAATERKRLAAVDALKKNRSLAVRINEIIESDGKYELDNCLWTPTIHAHATVIKEDSDAALAAQQDAPGIKS